MNAVQRALFRAPIWLYRWHLGWLLGRRMLLLEHRGRKSGETRRSVLEVTAVRNGAPVVVSGFGTSSDWYRNVVADPAVDVTWGRTSFAAVARRLDHAEAVEHFARYQVEHPRATKNLAERLGVPVDRDPEVAADALPAFVLESVDAR
jgi:deazaflavin-dependent oxidoreductase (nitroreductase family)